MSTLGGQLRRGVYVVVAVSDRSNEVWGWATRTTLDGALSLAQTYARMFHQGQKPVTISITRVGTR